MLFEKDLGPITTETGSHAWDAECVADTDARPHSPTGNKHESPSASLSHLNNPREPHPNKLDTARYPERYVHVALSWLCRHGIESKSFNYDYVFALAWSMAIGRHKWRKPTGCR